MDTRTSKSGIVDIAFQLPYCYCDVKELTRYLNLRESKYTIDFGLEMATACALNEDAVSLGLSAIKKLMERNNLTANDIGRIDVGTESNWDAAKPLKSYFMSLFKENKYIGGGDLTSSSYGGTSALLSAVHWIESSIWNGKYAIVVCTDNCLYEEAKFMPSAASAACAILVGKNPVFEFYTGLVEHYSFLTFDSGKPMNKYPYNLIDGKWTVEVYKKSFEHTFKSLKRKSLTDDSFDHTCFHTPYPKLPIKMCEENNISLSKVEKSLIFPKKVGNPYTSSLFLSLYSLVSCGDVKIGENVLMFGFGSGMSSSLFLIKKVRDGIFKEDIFEGRKEVNGKTFVDLLDKYQRDSLSDESLKCTKGFVIKSYNIAGREYQYLE